MSVSCSKCNTDCVHVCPECDKFALLLTADNETLVVGPFNSQQAAFDATAELFINGNKCTPDQWRVIDFTVPDNVLNKTHTP